ncbi:MAG: hypothetical protein ACRDD8_06225 [Bacteroidales bacterium]
MKKLVSENFRVICAVVGFFFTLYIQHLNNTTQLKELEKRCISLENKVQQQYERMDLIKLDKTVFEATMSTFSTMKDDMREIRTDIKELLKSK